MESELAIDLIDLRKDFGAQHALDGVTLSVPRGCVFGYVGPNGAGKTTTTKIITGLLRPTSGEARVLGRSVLSDSLQVKASLGYVPESGALFEKFSPEEYLTLVGRLYRLPEDVIQARIDDWLGRMNLNGQRRQTIGNLSKGMKQKICWISALLHDPEVVVLDEPLNGLDVESVALVKDLMAEWARSGRTVFYCSHLIDIVSKVCGRVAILHRGRIVASGTIDEVVAARNSDTLERALLDLSEE
jgi:ABC-2 type transport system ATP-binding protein